MDRQTSEFLFFFMIVWAIIGAIVTPIVFSRKGRNPVIGFFAGVVAGAIGGILILGPLWYFVPSVGKKCPQCAEKVQLEALVCKHCGHRFDVRSVMNEIQRHKLERKRANRTIVVGFAVVIAGGFGCFSLLLYVAYH